MNTLSAPKSMSANANAFVWVLQVAAPVVALAKPTANPELSRELALVCVQPIKHSCGFLIVVAVSPHSAPALCAPCPDRLTAGMSLTCSKYKSFQRAGLWR